MNLKTAILIVIILLIISAFAEKEMLNRIEVFHKSKKPSMQTFARVRRVLAKYKDEYEIVSYDIDDSLNIELIQKYNLPDTHFPFAVVINGKFSAQINENKIDFVHFPKFMRGIGRHEGNWSLVDLEAVLQDKSLLLEENILPVLEHKEADVKPCPGEE